MKKYILIVRSLNNRDRLLNQALYQTEAEAKKYKGWFQSKIKAERQAHKDYWKEEAMKTEADIFIGEVNY